MRHPDWSDRLFAVIREQQARAFAYGQHDCATFVAACVDAMTGSNWAASLPHTDEPTAQAAMQRGLGAQVTERLGRPISGWAARRGDVCQLDRHAGGGLGICVGDRVAAPGPSGVIYLPLENVLRHWRVN